MTKCGIAADQTAKIPDLAETRSKLYFGDGGFLYRGVIQFGPIHWAAVETLDYLLAKVIAAGPVRGGSQARHQVVEFRNRALADS